MTNITLPVGELSDALARCKHSMSNEETRYYLCGVHLRHVDGKAMLQSTDGHRLTQVRIPGDVPAFEGIILSRQSVADIQRQIKRKHHHQLATLSIGADNVLAFPGVDNIPVTLVDGTFPDCDRVIPRHDDKPKIITLRREDFLKAVAAINGFASANGNNPAMRLSCTDDKLTLSATNVDGSATMVCDCSSVDVPNGFTIGFNAGYLLDWVKTVYSDNIKITTSYPGSPTIFAGVGLDDHATTVILPLRI